jgi:hypothetical protein
VKPEVMAPFIAKKQMELSEAKSQKTREQGQKERKHLE